MSYTGFLNGRRTAPESAAASWDQALVFPSVIKCVKRPPWDKHVRCRGYEYAKTIPAILYSAMLCHSIPVTLA